jgi:RNA polymerase primary sigma factor
MTSFCHDQIARLAHELTLAPLRHRLRQIAGIGRAIDLIDPAKEYPYALICFHITGYRPKRTADSMLSGKELIADLVELLDALTAATPIPAQAFDQTLYDADALAKRFKVSTKTISRWRARGLAGCWVTTDAAKPKLAFTSRAVQRFIHRNRELIQRGASFQLMNAGEKAGIIERARELVAAEKASLHLVTLRLADETGRAVETIRYTLRKFDHENPSLALFDRAEQPQPIDEKTVIYEAYLGGDTVADLAERFNRRPNQITKIITTVRAERIAAEPLDYMYHAAFDAVDAEAVILAESFPGSRDDASEIDPTLSGVPTNLPPYLQDLYRTPLLTRMQEADLFRRMNFLLHQASAIRARLIADPTKALPADIARFDEKMDAARRIKNRITQANLRLVVSIAKKHLFSSPAANLFELVSDGNLSLMKAVEKFDYARGFAFSTYASYAIMRGFARSIPEARSHGDRYQTGCDDFLSVARDTRSIELPVEDEQAPIRHALSRGLGCLDDRERAIIERHFGIGASNEPTTLDEIGRELSLSKERVRQIELKALAKLRGVLGESTAALLAG